MSDLNILPLQQEHVPYMQPLEKACFGSQWTATDFQRELDNPSCHYFVSQFNNQLIGYLGYWQILEEAHITAIAVHPDFQKRHAAQQMMCKMLQDCLKRNINWITLEVKESNIKAQNLYHKFGFSVLGRRKNYYQADKQDALIMWTENIATEAYHQRLEQLMREERPSLQSG